MTRSADFLIAGIRFSVRADAAAPAFDVPETYLQFQVDGGGEPDFEIDVKGAGLPDWQAEPLFDSGGPWKLWSLEGGGTAISFHSTGMEEPYQLALVDPGFTRAETWLHPEVYRETPGFFPFTYPLDEVLAVNLLALGRGVEVHACGVSDGGRGILFPGVSGVGKSTMAKLWDDEEGVVVLSDDRIIITENDGEFWMHGTPWHGDAGIADPGGVRLEAICFLRHDETNHAGRLGPGQAASRLVARSFPTFWNHEGMSFTTGIAAGVAVSIPAYEMGFRPDRAAVEYVRGLL
ncbi:MAG: hypothetical protein C4534_06155 [Gaiellales bacterium]|nr:MAG: hypothetical protein C4534_06155 [Gaiellales bacterium]